MKHLIPKSIDSNTLNALRLADPFPKMLISHDQTLFLDSDSQELKTTYPNHSFTDFFTTFEDCVVATRKEVLLIGKDQLRVWFDVIGEAVTVNNERSVLIHVISHGQKSSPDTDVVRLSRLRELMLEINQSILDIEDSPRFFQLILINALKALENASLGTIFVRNNDTFEVVSYLGFDREIENFHLAIEDSFLYRATGGKMDRVVNVPIIKQDAQFHPIKTLAGDHVYIQSEISAPIMVNNQLYGMISIDSLKPNAFDDADHTSMAFIRSSIQIAITNQLTYAEKSKMALHDQLTTLYNRHYFSEQFDLIIEKASRYQERFNLIMFDLDRLKTVNDDFGHLVGDQVIKKVAFELLAMMRKSDILARFGGDEFIAVCFASDQQGLAEKCRKLEKELADGDWKINGVGVPVVFSFGISQYPDEGKTLAELIHSADSKLYEQKSEKKSLRK